MTAAYNRPGITLAIGLDGSREAVSELQRDLRRLGYLRAGIDGRFGAETARAVRALRWDLLHHDGHGRDREAPVALREWNRGRVEAVSGVLDEGAAACLEDLLGEPAVAQLPRAGDPSAANRRVQEAIARLAGPVPRPFLVAVLSQESALRHFREPAGADADDFIVVGLDRDDRAHPDRITSRGYGVGHYTLFHHPPHADEVERVMLDPAGNVGQAVAGLAEKFRGFVVGATAGTRADDRLAEIGAGALRACRYPPGDARYQRDCRRCAREARRVTLDADTPLFPGSLEGLRTTGVHPARRYDDVPDRAAFGCDWPYAVRRYSGSGINSFHYQAQVLRRLRDDPLVAAASDG